MIIKLEKVISCTSEDPSYPASNLLQQRSNSSWRCAKPGELLASVIFQFAETSTITGLDIANYRSCIVVVTASTSDEPDNWIPIINHQFMTHDEAANGKFKDQVQLFSKKDLNADTLKIKFDRVKVTCMQSANLREVFGLAFIVLRTEVTLQMGADIFGRFKLKNADSTLDGFKEKCLKMFPGKQTTYKESLAEKIKEDGVVNFAKRQGENREPRKRPILEKLEANAKEDKEKEETARLSGLDDEKKDVASTTNNTPKVARTPFGDVITPDNGDKTKRKNAKRPSMDHVDSLDKEKTTVMKKDRSKCTKCMSRDSNKDSICKTCNLLPHQKPDISTPPAKKPKVDVKPKKEFAKLFEGVAFALSGYVNPQRDEIRRKALKMGGRYVADPNTSNNKCTHLVCAFKNTPKSQQLRGHTKIVSHKFIEECFDKKIRFPWRRFALDSKEKAESESEEEIEAGSTNVNPPDPYEQETDSDSNY